MTSLIARRLGSDFERLHPMSRERHAVGLQSGVYSIGSGTMERVWHSAVLFRPFLRLGSLRNIMFPESGRDVPFRIECWPYRDEHGRETLSLNRSFDFVGRSGSRTRRFDEYLVETSPDESLSIYVGSHQHLVASIDVRVSERSGLVFETGPQRLFTRLFSMRFPMLLSASARVEEWYDEASGVFRIDARVRNRLLGDVFACVGSFESRLEPLPVGGVPKAVRSVVDQAAT